MSERFLLALINEAKSRRPLKGQYGRKVDFEERCFLVVNGRSGRKAVACVGANRAPEEEPTPQLETLTRVLCPEGFPGGQLFINGGADLVRALSVRLAELASAQQSGNEHPRVSRGRRVEAVCF